MIIWLASYPRSGNTFLRTTLNSAFGMKSQSMHGDNLDIGGEEGFAGIVGHVQGTVSEEDVDRLRRDSEVHLIKTHHSPSHYMDVDDSVIYIVRDGRDAVVSYYHYLKRIAGDRGMSLRDVATGMAGFGLWARHARDWELAQFRKRSVFRYEDMVKDNSLLIASLAEALGREPVSFEIPTFETLKGINSDFFRKGKVGSWADELNGTDEKLFWLHNGSMMLRYGYDTQLPAGLEALVTDDSVTGYFEERSYNSKREVEQFRRVLQRRDSQPPPPAPKPASAPNANGARPPANLPKIVTPLVSVRPASVSPASSVTPPKSVSVIGARPAAGISSSKSATSPVSAGSPASAGPSKGEPPPPQDNLAQIDRRLPKDPPEEWDIRWYVRQVLAEVVRKRDARSFVGLFLDRSASKDRGVALKPQAADLGWIANSVLTSRRSLKIKVAPAPDFDEQAYLRRYSDVKRAVEEGRISCGFAHYVHFGRKERRERPTI